MDTEAIITQWKNKTPEKTLCILVGGRLVIGEYIDEQNRLYYVIRDPNDKNKYSVESAMNQRISKRPEPEKDSL